MNALRNFFSSLAFLASLSLGFVPAFAAAATLGVDVGADVEVGVGGSAGAGTSSNATGSATTGASGSGSASAGVSGEGAVLFDLSQKDALDAAVSVTSPFSVTTNAELSAYARGQMQADANLEAVSATEQSLTVKHAAPARLFGIFPVHLTVTAMVDADGTVEVKYPWYRFFFATNRADLEATLTNRVSAVLGASANTSASAKASASAAFDASQKARALNAVQEAFADFSAEASASADASVSAAAS